MVEHREDKNNLMLNLCHYENVIFFKLIIWFLIFFEQLMSIYLNESF